jgi:hypothetical protein
MRLSPLLAEVHLVCLPRIPAELAPASAESCMTALPPSKQKAALQPANCLAGWTLAAEWFGVLQQHGHSALPTCSTKTEDVLP